MGGSESRPSSSSSDSSEREGGGGGGLSESQKSALKTTGRVAAAAVAIGALTWGVASMVASASDSDSEPDPDDNRKMMKAPGRNGETILRKNFENDTKRYFRDLRNKD